MTSKEEKIYKRIIMESVFEGVTRALQTLKITTYTPSPASLDGLVQDSSYHTFEQLWSTTRSTTSEAIQDKDRRGDLPKSSLPPSAISTTTNPTYPTN